LPAVLGRTELDELVDALAVLLDLTVSITAEPSRWRSPDGRGAILLVPAPVRKAPEPVPDAVVLCLRERAPGNWSLDLPREVLLIRDAVIECVGRQLGLSGLARVAAWAAEIADTPASAIRFMDGAQAHLLLNPKADDGSLYCAGLAAAVGWVLTGLDTRVAQWVLTLALRGVEPHRRVGTDAALLGKAEALRRAFTSGLVYRVPEKEGDPLDLRRPLEAMGRLDTAPGRPALTQLATHLEPLLAPAVREVLARAVRPAVHGLGLPAPMMGSRLAGREELVKRLAVLLEPSERIQTCVLQGAAGSGKTAVAATLAQKMAHRLETAWISFAEGPLAGWTRVAAALDMEINGPRAEIRDEMGVPRWVRELHARLAGGEYLLVVDDVDGIEEERLPQWLPVGPGRCSVLIISRSSQRPLQREHDAVSLHVPALTLEESRQLLELRVSHLAQEIGQGRADSLIERVGRHPGALILLANALANRGIEGTSESLSSARRDVDVVPKVLKELIERLDEDERKVLRAVRVCSPAGARIDLVSELSVGRDRSFVVERLVERGLLVQLGRMVRLDPLVRFCLDEQAEPVIEGEDDLIPRHAAAVSTWVEHALEKRDRIAQIEFYQELLLASERVGELIKRWGTEAVDICFRLGDCLTDVWLGSRGENLKRAVDAYEKVLEVWTREEFPAVWAGAQNNLGLALKNLPTGDRVENLRRAVAAFEKALEVWTREEFPLKWASAQNNLGLALGERPVGNRVENLRRAMAAFEKALEVWTREEFPADWAMAQANLGMMLAKLPVGDQVENLRRAVDAYEKVLEVWTREEFPLKWALVQNNLGNALMRLPVGNRVENLSRAVEACEKALGVFTREEFPVDWARAQVNLGSALAQLLEGDRAENLRRAVEAYEKALEVWTREEFPADWARAQAILGVVFRQLQVGDRRENLRRSQEAYEAALTVLTPENDPEMHKLALAGLLATQNEVEKLSH
jgi:tetratricopeptide (TPR) repeat protein